MHGRAILEGISGQMLGVGFQTELIYSFVIICCSLMVYLGTKELYELTSHKGIKYFRQAFLFFAIAYAFRSVIKFMYLFLNLNPRSMVELSFFLSPLTIFFFMYLSSMAIFYLLYSVMWKKWQENSNKIYLFHVLAFVLSLIVTFTKNPVVYLSINLFLFVFVIFTVLVAYKNSKKSKGHNLYITYVFLLVFWILNIIDILVPNFLQKFQLFIYFASIGLFLSILYKVLRKTG